MPLTLRLAAVAATFALSALSMPTNLHRMDLSPLSSSSSSSLLPRGAEGEAFTCPDGTAAAKQALLDAGAQPMDIAIAMLENGCAFTGAFSIGNNKVGDAAELGVYRNNWYMLRQNCDHFAGAGPDEWESRGQEVHGDVTIATECQRQLFSKLGETTFFGLQRGGTGDMGAGVDYGNYCHKYLDFVNQGHLSDDMATYYNVVSM
ncbi:MAG: hypothetical protein Q9168_005242 [Polycauliona sp. 1 TL-2023]